MLSTKKFFRIKIVNLKKKEEKLEENSGEELKEYISNTVTFIDAKSKGINNDLFTKFLNFLKLIDLDKKII